VTRRELFALYNDLDITNDKLGGNSLLVRHDVGASMPSNAGAVGSPVHSPTHHASRPAPISLLVTCRNVNIRLPLADTQVQVCPIHTCHTTVLSQVEPFFLRMCLVDAGDGHRLSEEFHVRADGTCSLMPLRTKIDSVRVQCRARMRTCHVSDTGYTGNSEQNVP
jgi:hypothetical protein